MLYLIDANVLIHSKDFYYEFARVSEYWGWLEFQVKQGRVKIPIQIHGEIMEGNDQLTRWVSDRKAFLVLDEKVNVECLQRVISQGYGLDPDSADAQQIGKDPFLIAYALAEQEERMVVTNEKRSGHKGKNRRIPSVCDDLEVKSCDQWEFGRALDFRTTWKNP